MVERRPAEGEGRCTAKPFQDTYARGSWHLISHVHNADIAAALVPRPLQSKRPSSQCAKAAVQS